MPSNHLILCHPLLLLPSIFPSSSWQIDGETRETVTDFIFLGSKITADGDYSHEIKRCLLLGSKADTPKQCIKKQRHHFASKGLYSQTYGFSSSHLRMWELDHKEGWVSTEELMPSNGSSGEDSWKFLGLQRDQNHQFKRKSVLHIHWKDWCWSCNTLVT